MQTLILPVRQANALKISSERHEKIVAIGDSGQLTVATDPEIEFDATDRREVKVNADGTFKCWRIVGIRGGALAKAS